MSEPTVPPPGGPTVRIADWLNEAWAILQQNWLEYILAVLVFELVVVLGIFACLLPGILLAGPMLGGVHIYLAKRLLGLPAEVGDVFKGFRRFGDTLLLGLALALPPILIFALFLIPHIVARIGMEQGGPLSGVASAVAGISGCITCFGLPLFGLVYPVVVGTLVVFALPLILFQQMGAFDAIKQSIEIVKPQFMGFLVLLSVHMLIVWVASAAGGVLLCVGTLVLSPLAVAPSTPCNSWPTAITSVSRRPTSRRTLEVGP
jgi:hypothetical protein